MFKSFGKVSPFKPGSSSSSKRVARFAQQNGSQLLESIASLSPSQLDQALMKMLNIDHAPGSTTGCEGNPITKNGKRMQLLRMLGLCMIPVMVLLGLSCTLFGSNLTDHINKKDIRAQIKLSTQISELVHNLQQERDMSSLYSSDIGPDLKSFLLKRYPMTNAAIESMKDWPTSGKAKLYYETKGEFVKHLNLHRYELDTKPSNQKGELDFYTNIIDDMILWFFDSVTEAQTGTVWKELVALQHVIMAKESFGIERAYGNMYYAQGGFGNRDEYLMFIYNQDVANYSFYEAKQFSAIIDQQAERIINANAFMNNIRQLRYEIKQNATASFGKDLTTASTWFDNMTFFIDALLTIQNNLTDIIDDKLQDREKEDETVLLMLGLMMGLSLIVCPIVLNAVYVLTTDIQNYSITLANRTKALNKEKRRTDTLLYQMIPKPIAEQLKMNENVSAELFTESSVFFSDIVGFTKISSECSPIQVVSMLNFLYTCFDERIQRYDVYKVETIGDAYMVSSGVPHRNGLQHVVEIATMSLDLLDHVSELEIPHMPGRKFRIRIGMHSGSVVAGVVGSKMPRYCLFGETVAIASKMEATGIAGHVHISASSHQLLYDIGGFQMELRTDDVLNIPNHGKGRMHASDQTDVRGTFWLLNRTGMVHSRNKFDTSSASSSDFADRSYAELSNSYSVVEPFDPTDNADLQTSYI